MKDETVESFTLDGVAGYLKVGKRTFYRLAGEKKIPFFKLIGAWRFQYREIDRWIERKTAVPAGAPARAHGLRSKPAMTETDVRRESVTSVRVAVLSEQMLSVKGRKWR